MTHVVLHVWYIYLQTLGVFCGKCCKYSSTVEHQSDLYLSMFILQVAMYIYIVIIIIVTIIITIVVYCYYHYFYFYYCYLCMIVSLFIYPSIYPSAYNDNIL
jgi:hypothetical protein